MKVTIIASRHSYSMAAGIGIEIEIGRFVRRYGWAMTTLKRKWMYPLILWIEKRSPIIFP